MVGSFFSNDVRNDLIELFLAGREARKLMIALDATAPIGKLEIQVVRTLARH